MAPKPTKRQIERLERVLDNVTRLPSGLREDAAFTAHLAEELAVVSRTTYDQPYDTLMASALIPPSPDSIDEGAEEYLYDSWGRFGAARILASDATDLPLLDALRQRFRSTMHTYGGKYRWTIQDMKRAAMSGSNLVQRKARSARDLIEYEGERLAAKGDAAAGLTGFANNAGVQLVSPPTGTWSSATSVQKLEDLLFLVSAVQLTGKELFSPDTLVLTNALWVDATKSRMSNTGDTTGSVMSQFREICRGITNVAIWEQLTDADVAGTGPRIACYKRDDRVLHSTEAHGYQELAPQAKDLGIEVPATARQGSIVFPMPIGAAYMDGL